MDLKDFFQPASKQPQYLKLLLTGMSGVGKTSSVVFGCPKPLLVFDLERGAIQYSKVSDFHVFQNDKAKGFDETSPDNILWYLEQLLSVQKSGHQIPFKSILLDSGTVLYNRILNDYLQELREDGKPNKRKLEPNEYAFPKAKFYKIIRTLKQLNVHVFITCHASDNYLKGDFMRVDPSDPIKPDCEKRLLHEMDVHYILAKHGQRFKATLKKSRLIDKQGKTLLAPVIDNFSNFDLVPMLIEMMNKDAGFDSVGVDVGEGKNQISTDTRLSQARENTLDLIKATNIGKDELDEILNDIVDGKAINDLTYDELAKVYKYFKGMLEVETEGNME